MAKDKKNRVNIILSYAIPRSNIKPRQFADGFSSL